MEITFCCSGLSQHDQLTFFRSVVMLNYSVLSLFSRIFDSYNNSSDSSDLDLIIAIDNFYDCVYCFSQLLKNFSSR